MSLSMYAVSVPIFVRGLEALSGLLAKSAAHAAAQGIDPATLIGARLAPDMMPLSGQVQRASDTAKATIERLGGGPAPKMADDEIGFDDLQGRIARTIAFLKAVDPEALQGSESTEVVLPFPSIPPFTGEGFLLTFALPNFYFHIATAHDILRHKGVAIGKLDYLGSYA